MTCPICEGAKRRLFQKHGYWICACEACDHRWTEISLSHDHVDQIYGDHYFQEGGDGYPDYLAEADIITAHGKYYARLLAHYTEPGTLLDVGAAAGFILKGFQEAGWRGRGIEPNSSMAEYARTRLGIQVAVGALETLPGDEQYDLVSMIQVVAHFYDLQQALQAAAKVTKPGGFWLIESWNRNSWTAKGFGQHWHEYSPPSVLHWFSPEGLSNLVAQFGFREVAKGRPTKWLNPAHAKSLLQYKLENSRWGYRMAGLVGAIPNHLPIPYPGDDLFWSLYKKLEI